MRGSIGHPAVETGRPFAGSRDPHYLKLSFLFLFQNMFLLGDKFQMGSLWSDCIPAKFGNVWYIQYRLRERVHVGSRARACGSAGAGLKDHGRGSEESQDVRS